MDSTMTMTGTGTMMMTGTKRGLGANIAAVFGRRTALSDLIGEPTTARSTLVLPASDDDDDVVGGGSSNIPGFETQEVGGGSSNIPGFETQPQSQEAADVVALDSPGDITLESIGLTMGAGVLLGALTFFAFGCAVRLRSTKVAPRCGARHPDTIYRTRKDMYGGGRSHAKRREAGERRRRSKVLQKELTKKKLFENKLRKEEKERRKKGAKEEKKDIEADDFDNEGGSDYEDEDDSDDDEFDEEFQQEFDYKHKTAASSSLPPPAQRHPSQTLGGAALSVLQRLKKKTSSASTNTVGGVDNAKYGHGDSDNRAPPIFPDTIWAHPQDRGNAFFGWIPWTLHLSYDRMLRGVPGTGTRDGGMAGKLLGVNLDAIVLFRFHALCLRITVLACFLSIGVLLPLNLTAACSESQEVCELHAINFNMTRYLTNYGKTTIANIPAIPIYVEDDVQTNIFSSALWTSEWLPQLLRLYIVTLCSMLVTAYSLHCIKTEWRENLVLRRVYYLEADHYGKRAVELDETIYSEHANDTDEDDSDDSDDGGSHKEPGDYYSDDDISNNRRQRRDKNKGTEKPHDQLPRYKRRPPFIPHPEQRDTIPNIELYSVLVGGIPSIPTEVVDSKDVETALAYGQRASIDWQLAVATTFFDHCVPNQPGFSSSVVAVTILPGAKELATAWRKWYAAAAALRRLRFIRQVISSKRYYAIDEDVEMDQDSEKKPGRSNKGASPSNGASPYTDDDETSGPRHVTFLDDNTASNRIADVETKQQMAQFRHAFATSENTMSDVDYRIFKHFNYGPEQRAVYTREMAQGAAPCCPNGCCEGRVQRSGIEELLAMEDKAIDRLQKAQEELQSSQRIAAFSILDHGDGDGEASDDNKRTKQKFESKHNTEIMLRKNPAGWLSANPEGWLSESAPEEQRGADDTMTTADGSLSVGEGSRPPPTMESVFNGSMTNEDEEYSTGVAPKKTDYPGNFNSNETNAQQQQQQLTQSQLQTIHENLPPAFKPHSRSPLSVKRTPSFSMTSEGKFKFNDAASAFNDEDDVYGSEEGSRASRAAREQDDCDDGSLASSTMRPGGQQQQPIQQQRLGGGEEHSSLRRRTNTGTSFLSQGMSDGDNSKTSRQWDQVESIMRGDDKDVGGKFSERSTPTVDTGVVRLGLPSFSLKSCVANKVRSARRWARGKTEIVAKDSTYAVVTFSSRQAAVAARHCLADGRGVLRWLSVETVPVPPLADAAPCDFVTCRGCCRPVTLNLNRNQKIMRRYCALASLAFIYVFYTIPITAATNIVNPSSLKSTLPVFYEFLSNNEYLSVDILSGLVSALLYTLFFALCPVIFKVIANTGSQAMSIQEAEKAALQYYWYFMLVTAFAFSYIANAAISIYGDTSVEKHFQKLLFDISSTVPLATSATWLNWIIVRTTMTLPLQYLLQVNSFVFSCLGLKCCARCVMGGGPGGPIPYRIYIDAGVVFVCVVALAPQSPLVAPVCLMYYLFCVPLWRRNCIFMYRPKFDTGGERWPFLSDVLITSLFVGHILLTLQMLQKEAIGPATMAMVPAIPTYLYRSYLIKRFRKAYDDAGLLQTSLLDGWDNTIPTSIEKREEFRRFLVDSHRAAYIPVCIAGGATNILTAEPAVAIPSENDDMLGYSDVAANSGLDFLSTEAPPSPFFGDQSPARTGQPQGEGVATPTASQQHGAFLRRTTGHTPRAEDQSASFSLENFPTDPNENATPKSRTTVLQARDRVNSIPDEADPGCIQS